MAANDYHFVTRWRLRATPAEVYAVLEDAASLPRWWPAVYLAVREVDGGAAGDGRVFALHTRGWLPYTLRWSFRVTEQDPPRRLAREAWGDFVGTGAWSFEADAEWTEVTYDWRIRADKPLLRACSPVLKPAFAANHRWAMETGEASLALELARRRAAGDEERARIAAPVGRFAGAAAAGRRRRGPPGARVAPRPAVTSPRRRSGTRA